MSSKTICWGILGLGNIAEKFASDLSGVSGVELHAVASRHLPKAQEFAKKYQALKGYGSYEDLVKDPSLDAIYIATPHALHKSHTLLCLNHGKPVLCEKPFAMNADEVEEMIQLAQHKNLLLMEALWTYFLPHYKFVLDLIQSGDYGDIKSMSADFGFAREFDTQSRLFDKSLGGGSLLDIGIYPVFAALSVLGEPNEISANASFFPNGVDSECLIDFEYENGVTAKLHSSLKHVTPCEAIFHCDNGTIKINKGFHGPSSVTIISNSEQRDVEFDYSDFGYSYEIEHFNQLLRSGQTQSPIMTFDTSRALIKTLDKIREKIGLHYSFLNKAPNN